MNKNFEKAFLEFRSISKSFQSVAANQNISFSINAGSIHAIIGENGAGKSTLMKILFGLYQADQGQILLRGIPVQVRNAIDAKQLGIGMVHQHFMLAGPITALDHIVLDQRDEKTSNSFLRNWLWPIPRKQILNKVIEVAQKFNMPVPWTEPVERLPVGIQQRLEILKLLYNNADLLILDEPTAVLTPQEIEALFMQLKGLRAAGKTIIIITHKLKEVVAIADEFTVLRQGKLVHSGPIAGQTVSSLGELMIGRLPKVLERSKAEISNLNQGTPRLIVKQLSYSEGNQHLLKNVSLEIQPGEVVGLAGVEANGQSQLLDLIFQPQTLTGKKSGEVKILDVNCLELSNQKIRTLGVNYFPEDRLRQALLLNENASENFLLGQQWRPEYSKMGWILWKKLRLKVSQMIKDFDVRPFDNDLPLSRFSGGNQQKFVVGRELSQNPQLLIAAQPTRGVDIGAIESIHDELLKQKKRGASIFLVSSDLDEVMKLSDRIYVIFDGELVAHLTSDNFDEKKIGAHMGGAR